MTLRRLPVPLGADAYLAFDKEAGQRAHGADGFIDEKEMETLSLFEKLLRSEFDEETFG